MNTSNKFQDRSGRLMQAATKVKPLISDAAREAEERLDRVLDLVAAERERMAGSYGLLDLTKDFGHVAIACQKAGQFTARVRSELRALLIKLAARAVMWAEHLEPKEAK